jgi:hypothetical protein
MSVSNGGNDMKKCPYCETIKRDYETECCGESSAHFVELTDKEIAEEKFIEDCCVIVEFRQSLAKKYTRKIVNDTMALTNLLNSK